MGTLYSCGVDGKDAVTSNQARSVRARIIIKRYRKVKDDKDKSKTVTIVIEGTPHEWSEKEISYAQVVTLEVPDYAANSNITYSVTYKRGQGNKPEGTLAPGASVKVKEGMRFSVSETGQS